METRAMSDRQTVEPRLAHRTLVRVGVIHGNTALVGEPDLRTPPVEAGVGQTREHALGHRSARHRAEEPAGLRNGLCSGVDECGGRDRGDLIGIHESQCSRAAGRRESVCYSRGTRGPRPRGEGT